MTGRALIAKLTFAAAILICTSLHAEVANQTELPPVVIDYYFEAGCADCFRVRSQVMPDLKERYEGFYTLNEYDLSEKTNVLRLIAYQEKAGVKDNDSVCMIVDYGQMLNGVDAINGGLFVAVERAIAARMEPGWRRPEPLEFAEEGAEARLRDFTPGIVAANGLIDGINPCAISTLVFFMSLLGVSRVKGRGLLTMGVCFCLASFVTYTAIGFGLLRVLYLFDGFLEIRFGVELAMMIILGVFAYLSFRDAYRYRKSGNPGDVTIQLPDGLKRCVRWIMRVGVGRRTEEARRHPPSLERLLGTSATALQETQEARTQGPALQEKRGAGQAQGVPRAGGVRGPALHETRGMAMLALGGFVVGAGVTAIESVCTGQVYLPTLVLVAREGGATSSTAWSYLLVYNTMFIVPLVVVFALTFLGLRTQTLLVWSKRHVVPGKILLGMFFVAMAILIGII